MHELSGGGKPMKPHGQSVCLVLLWSRVLARERTLILPATQTKCVLSFLGVPPMRDSDGPPEEIGVLQADGGEPGKRLFLKLLKD